MIAAAYHTAHDRMQYGGSEEAEIRKAVGEIGITLPGKRWTYQMEIVRRIVDGEYGGLPRGAQPSSRLCPALACSGLRTARRVALRARACSTNPGAYRSEAGGYQSPAHRR